MSERILEQSDTDRSIILANYREAETAIRQLERFEKRPVPRGQELPRREARGVSAVSGREY